VWRSRLRAIDESGRSRLVRALHRLVGMNTRETHVKGPGAPRIQWTEIIHRMRSGVTELQSNVGDKIKHDPFAALGIAAAAGVGVGIVLGSRILRAALTSALSYGIVEFARSLVEERVPMANGFHVPRTAESPRSSHS
jgi:hypothetical protein